MRQRRDRQFIVSTNVDASCTSSKERRKDRRRVGYWWESKSIVPPADPLLSLLCSHRTKVAHVSTPLTVQDTIRPRRLPQAPPSAVAVVVVVVCSARGRCEKYLNPSKMNFLANARKPYVKHEVTYFSSPLRSELSEKEVRVVTANGNKKFFPKLLSESVARIRTVHPYLQ